MFTKLLMGFAVVAVPAAGVNAGLKYCQKQIQLAFMRRLTHHLHQHYCSHRAYYAASTLGGEHSQNFQHFQVRSVRSCHAALVSVPHHQGTHVSWLYASSIPRWLQCFQHCMTLQLLTFVSICDPPRSSTRWMQPCLRH